MSDIMWPVAASFIVYLIAIVLLFWLTDNPAIQEQLIGLFQSLSSFLIGVVAGGAAGGTIGYLKAKK